MQHHHFYRRELLLALLAVSAIAKLGGRPIAQHIWAARAEPLV
jgi:hypothetical protein